MDTLSRQQEIDFGYAKVDKEAEKNAPDILNGYPYLELEQLFGQHNLKSEIVEYLPNEGMESVSFKIHSPKGALFLKVFFGEDFVPKDIITDFILKTSGKSPGNVADRSGVDDTVRFKRQNTPTYMVERKAAAYVVGHKVRPNRVDDLDSIWTWNGKPVAISTKFIEGKPHTSAPWLPHLKDDADALDKVGVIIDNRYESDNSILETATGNEKFIDLMFVGRMGANIPPIRDGLE